MKYLLIIHHDEEAFAQMGEATKEAMLAESIQLYHRLDRKGQNVHASPLQPTKTATLVRVRGGKMTHRTVWKIVKEEFFYSM